MIEYERRWKLAAKPLTERSRQLRGADRVEAGRHQWYIWSDSATDELRNSPRHYGTCIPDGLRDFAAVKDPLIFVNRRPSLPNREVF